MRSDNLCLALLCLALAGPAGAGESIYGFTDDAGVTHLSNVPDSEPYKLMLPEPDNYRVRSKSDYRLPYSTTELPANTPYADEIVAAANDFGVEPALLHAVISVESNHNPAARSPKGAMGLMQLMPDTSRRFSVTDPWQPAQNIRGGARYLSELLTQFDNDLPLALAAYNAGEQAVIRYGRQVPPFPETRDYVKKVIYLYRQQTAGDAPKAPARAAKRRM